MPVLEAVKPAVPVLTENALRVLESRYLDRTDGEITETPEQLFRRVAKCVASVEDENQEGWEKKFYEVMMRGRFLPNSPTLMNAGRRLGMLSACFVLPVPDDTDSIMQSVKETARIQKAGGGTGFAFDELRPCGAYVKSSGGQSSGPLSFWRIFAETTAAIQQGSFRRGANMAMMRIDHPDIIKFLYAKQDLQQFSNYNISVKVTDDWIQLAKARPDAPFVVRWKDDKWYIPREIVTRCQKAITAGQTQSATPRELDICYGLSDLIQLTDTPPDDVLTVGEVLDIIVRHAWATGEPGLCFIDRIRETESTPDIQRIQATNPCGEEPLLPNESCNLGSLNLGKYVKPLYGSFPMDQFSKFANDGYREHLVDWDQLRDDVGTAVRFLDNVVSVNRYPTKAIDETCKANRKVGLGIMGFADALLRLGVRYDSDEGVLWANKLMGFVNRAAIEESRCLAEARGSFPNHDRSIWKDRHPMRNACVTSVAPTGTISIIANASGGIEPWFSFVFRRQVLGGETMLEYQQDLKRVSDEWGFGGDELLDHVYEHGTLQDRDDVPDVVKSIFRTARDISPEWHVKMQAAFQANITSAVSKTINLPHDAPEDEVRAAYLLAHELRCKGVTVYRDGARAMQPMALKKSGESYDKDTNGQPPSFRCPVNLTLPLPSIRTQYKSTYGSLHIHVSLDQTSDGRFREREVFFDLGRSGDSVHPITSTYARLVSMLLRMDGRMEMVIDQLRGHVAHNEKLNGRTGGGTSLPSELSLALLDYFKMTAEYRDDNGFLTQLPVFGYRNGPRKSSGGNGNATAFISRVANAAAIASSRLRTPCPTGGCPGEVIFAEGCRKCIVCGEGACS